MERRNELGKYSTPRNEVLVSSQVFCRGNPRFSKLGRELQGDRF